MKQSLGQTPTTLRVFCACLISFNILLTPIAAIAASIREPEVRSQKSETTSEKTGKAASNDVFVNPPVVKAEANVPSARPEPAPLPLAPPAGADISATMTAVLQNDDGDTKIDPNPPTTETINYSVTLTSSGAGGTGLSFSNPLDSHTSLVVVPSSSLNSTPVTFDQSVSTNEDAAVSITIQGQDPDGSNLTFLNGATNLPFAASTALPHGTLGAFSAPSCNGVGVCSSSATYTPAADYFGADSFTFKVNDGTASSNEVGTVSITVNGINDIPSFSGNANPGAVNEDAGLQTVTSFRTNVTPGPANEQSTQTVSFVITNVTHSALFSSQPALNVVASAGPFPTTATLTYTPAANANGTSVVTYHLHDSGGTSNGGVDNTPDQTFTITVNAVNDPPVVDPVAKAFTLQANMKRTGLGGLLTNATDPDATNGNADPLSADAIAGYTAPSLTLTSVTGACTALAAPCTISNVQSSGSFDFDPTPGVTGAITLNYTITDAGNPGNAVSAAGTITITVNGPVIWFVDTALGVAGTGRLSAPFNTLALATGAMSSAANQRIFVFQGSNTALNTAVSLQGNNSAANQAAAQVQAQWLIGQGTVASSFDSFFGISPPANTITRPTLTNVAATANGMRPTIRGLVTMRENCVVQGLNINVSGAAAGTKGIQASGLLPGSSTSTLVIKDVNVTSAAGNAVDLSAASLSANNSVSYTSSDTTNSTNVLVAAGGLALNVVNLTIAAGGLSFKSISANGGTKGITLNNTGTVAGLTVYGSGTTDGSGGTIQNNSTRGAEFINTSNLSLKNMNFTNADNSVDGGAVGVCDDSTVTGCNAALVLNGVSASATLDNLNITGTMVEHGILAVNVANFKFDNSLIDNAGDSPLECGVKAVNLSGTSTVNSTEIRFSESNSFDVINTSTPVNMTVNGSTFRDTQTVSSGGATNLNGDGGFQFRTFGTGTSTINVLNSSFLRLRTQGIQVLADGSSTVNVDINNDTIDAQSDIGTGIDINSNTTATLNFNITGNPTIQSRGGSAVNITSFLQSHIEGRVNNNPDIEVLGAAGIPVRVVAQEQSHAVVLIDNNTVSNVNGTEDTDIDVQSRFQTARADVTITRNTVTPEVTGVAGINLISGSSTAGESNITCGKIGGTSLGNNVPNAVGNTVRAFRVRNSDVSNTNRLYLEGFTTDVPTTWIGRSNLPAVAAEVTTSLTGTAVAPSAPPGGICEAVDTSSDFTFAPNLPGAPNLRGEVAGLNNPFQGDPLFSLTGGAYDLASILGENNRNAESVLPVVERAQPTSLAATVAVEGKSANKAATPVLTRAVNSLGAVIRTFGSLIEPTAHASTEANEIRNQKSEVRSQRLAVKSNHAETTIKGDGVAARNHTTTAPVLMSPPPGTFPVNGTGSGFTLPPGKTTTITFKATLNNPPNLSGVPPATPKVSAQGQLNGVFVGNPIFTDDPAVLTNTPPGDPTVTLVDLFDTTTTLGAVPAAGSWNVGQPVTFTATVTPNPANATPVSGTVVFKDNGTAIPACNGATGVTVSSGTAQCVVTFASGAHSVVAVYSGDANYECCAAFNTSNTLSQGAVNQSGTTTAVGSSKPGGSLVTESVTFTATVTSSTGFAGPPTGNVDFYDGTLPGAPLISGCSARPLNGLAQATCTTSALNAAGSPHTITAVYNPGADPNFLTSTGSVSQAVSKSGTNTGLSTSGTPSSPAQQVTYTALVTSQTTVTGPFTGNVIFKDNTTDITGSCEAGSQTLTAGGAATCKITYANTTGSPHPITAVYSGDGTFITSTSSIVNQTVDANATTTTLVSSQNPSAPTDALTFTATISPSSATGTVDFKDNNLAIIPACTGVAVVTGSAQCNTPGGTFANGTHPITAVYSGDAVFSGSTSNTVNQNVQSCANPYVVTKEDDDGTAGTLRTGVNGGVCPGGTITFAPSVHTIELVNSLDNRLVPVSDMTITGPGASQLTVQRATGAFNFRIFEVGAFTVTISGMTISNGKVVGTTGGGFGLGGGISNAGTLTLSDVVVSGNQATGGAGANGGAGTGGTGGFGQGGGIFNGNILTLNNSTVSGNKATGGNGGDATGTNGNGGSGQGGGIYNTGTLTVNSSSVNGTNAATGGAIGTGGTGGTVGTGTGGGIYSEGSASAALVTIFNSTISANTSSTNGGGIANISTGSNANLAISDSTISGNFANGSGGGVFNDSGTSVVTLNSVTITGNYADNDSDTNGVGGGIETVTNNLTLNNTIVAGNLKGAAKQVETLTVAVTGGGTLSAGGNASITISGDSFNGGVPQPYLVPVTSGQDASAVATDIKTELENGTHTEVTNFFDILVVGAIVRFTVKTAADNDVNLNISIDSCTCQSSTSQAGLVPANSANTTPGSVPVNQKETLTVTVTGGGTLSAGGNASITISGDSFNLGVPQTYLVPVTALQDADAVAQDIKTELENGTHPEVTGFFNPLVVTANKVEFTVTTAADNDVNLNISIDSCTCTAGLDAANSANTKPGVAPPPVKQQETVTVGVTGSGTLSLGGNASITISGDSFNGGVPKTYSVPVTVGQDASAVAADIKTELENGSYPEVTGFFDPLVVTGAAVEFTVTTAATNDVNLNISIDSCTCQSSTTQAGLVPANSANFSPGGTASPNDITGTVDGGSSYNLIGDAATRGGLTDLSSDAVHQNQVGNSGSSTVDINTVLFTTLASNGGPTMTHALKSAGPAVDKGKDFTGPPATDQRGFQRPFDDLAISNATGGDGSDIGAFERQAGTTAPATPNLQDGSDSSGSTGTSSDDITKTTPRVFDIGSVTNGATVELLRDTNPLGGSEVVVATGIAAGASISLSDPNVLADGDYYYRARQTVGGDAATSVLPGLKVTIDKTAPTTAAPDLQNGDDSGSPPADDLTKTTPRHFDITGTESGALVELLRGATVVDFTTSGGGTVTLTDSVALADGPYSYTTRQTDIAGNVATSSALVVTMDNTAPATPSAPDLQDGSDSFFAPGTNGDNITKFTPRTFDVAFITEANSTVELLRNGVPVTGASISGASSPVTLSDPDTLTDGLYVYTVRQTDRAGNATTSLGLTVQIDVTSAPSVPALQAGSDSGASSTDKLTKSVPLSFDITNTENGALVELYRGVTFVTSTTGNGGTVTLSDPAALTDGSYDYTTRQTDIANNVGTSAISTVTIDKSAPATPSAPDLQAASDTGDAGHHADNITSAAAGGSRVFDLSFTAEANSTIELLRNGVSIASTSGASSPVPLADPNALTDGTYTYSVRHTDAAGNVSTSAGLDVVIDTTAPTVSTVKRANPLTTTTNAQSVDFEVTFSEPVTGVDATDFQVTASAGITLLANPITGITPNVDGIHYTVTVDTGGGDGSLRLDVVDNDSIQDIVALPLGGSGAGNGSFNTGEVYLVNKTSPAVTSIVRANSNPTNASSVDFTVTFSRSVTGVDATDFFITSAGLTGVPGVTNVSGSGATYTVTVSTGTGTSGAGAHTLRLDLRDDDSIKDSGSEPLAGTGTFGSPTGDGSHIGDQLYDIDKTAPIINSFVQAPPVGDVTGPSNTTVINFRATFSEPMINFTSAGIQISGTAGATVANITEIAPNDGTTFNVGVEGMTQSGTVGAQILAGGATDTAGNPTPASGTVTVNYLLDNLTTLEVNLLADSDDGHCDALGAGAGNQGCTLREAINAANTDAGAETIAFNATVFAAPGPHVISLLTALPDITTDMTIQGPAANVLTVERNSGAATRFRIFTINSGTVTLSGMTITKGLTADGLDGGSGAVGASGGGILNSGTLTLSGVAVTSNTTGKGGNGTAASGGSGGSGGGISNNAGTLTVTNSTISGNQTGNGGNTVVATPNTRGGSGGGISNSGTLTVTNSTISGNQTGAPGTGGILGGSNGFGGGIETNNNPLTISNSTITANNAGTGNGGGIRQSGAGIITIKSTIVGGNTAAIGPDIEGSVNSEGYNLIQSTSDVTINETLNAGTNITGQSPQLNPLADYGGPTLTHSLQCTSPAIDKGNAFGLTTDQRGGTRPFDFADGVYANASGGDGSDIGAFETQSAGGCLPTAIPPAPAPTTNEDTSVVITLTGTYSQPNTPLTFTITQQPANAPALTLSPANCPSGGLSQTCTATVTYTPNANFNGADLFKFKVSAGAGLDSDSADVNVTVNPLNDAPSFFKGGTQTVAEDAGPQTVANFANTILAGPADESGQTLQFIVTNNTNAALFSAGPAIDATTGDLTFTSAANAYGSAQITVVLKDNGGSGGGNVDTSAPQTFTINVTGVADTPSVTNATTPVNTQTTSGLVISRNAADGVEVTHFQITNITGGTLFKNNGTTQINNNDFITFTEGNQGLKFTPALNSNTNGSFDVQASLNNAAGGLGGGTATATITITCGSAVVTNSNDIGAGSLRDVILHACAGATITFNMTPGNVTSPITLTSGELSIDKDLTIQGPGANLLTISGNNASRIFNIASTFTVGLSGLTMSNGRVNAALSEGGAIQNNGTLTITSSTISGNTVNGSGLNLGGGISNKTTGNLTLRDSTISGNSATGGSSNEGGGIFNQGVATVINSTISGNSATIGGGISVDPAAGNVSIINSTVSGNSASFVAGGVHASGTVNVRNTIVAGNTAPTSPDVRNAFVSQGNNLIGAGDGSTGFTNGVNNDQVGTVASPLNALLAPLGNYGGPTQTLALLPGSSAIDAANNCVTDVAHCGDANIPQLTTDQRGAGFNRLVNTTVDIGAFESRGFTVATTSGNLQSAVFNTAFGAPLVVTVSSAFAEPVSGGQVVFTAPGSGASATFTGGGTTITSVINAGGQASASATANATVGGPYLVTVTGNGITSPANFNLTNIKADQTITFGAIANKTFGDPDFGVSATATSGLPVSFAVSGNCTVSSPSPGTVHITGAGSCTITASQAGDANYNPAANVLQGFTISKANQTINFAALANKTFGDPDFGVIATSTSGLAVSLVASGNCTVTSPSPGTVHITGAGSCTITASQTGDANYNPATSVPQSFNIARAATSTAVTSSVNPSDSGQSVTFTATVTSGAGIPTATVQFKDNGTNLGAAVALNASGVAQFTTSTLTAATHTITAEYSGDANFLPSTGTLSGGQVVKAQPSLSINDVSIVEGDAGTKLLNFTVTLSAASSLTVTTNYATADGTATAPSDYTAIASTLLTFNPGDTSKQVSVTINGDVGFESDETFFVNLSNAVNATISDNQGLGTIQNDDAQGGFISFSQPNYNVSESTGLVTVTVTRTNDVSQAAQVDYATDDTGASINCAALNTGLASQRCDYTSMFGTLRFAANETQKTVDIPINLDAYTEGPEVFRFNLSNATGGAVLSLSTATVTISDSPSPTPNTIDDTASFVRQLYHDFLNRDADAAGLAFWKNNIDKCNDPAQRAPGQTLEACIEVQRIVTIAAFFLSIEFKQTGGTVRDFYVAALDRPLSNNMPGFVEFMRDTQAIQKGVAVGQGNWQQVLDANRLAFMNEFVTRAEFVALYPTTDTPTQYVDKLYQHANVTQTQQERLDAIEYFGGAATAADTGARARALLLLTQNGDFQVREIRRAFVQMQYLGYLRRTPNEAPDNNFDGFNFWVTKLNQFNGDYLQAEMVKAFLTSLEYRRRFGQ